MSTYAYTLLKKNGCSDLTGFRKRSYSEIESIFVVVLTLSPELDPVESLWNHLLNQKQHRRYFKLIEDFDGTVDQVEKFHDFLPSSYQEWASDPVKLKENLSNLSEIKSKYQLLTWKKTSSCYGCQQDLPSQDDHMDCISGCLHIPEYCIHCREN